MANIYRKAALDKISSPDQLDQVTRISNPLSWLALGSITCLIVIITIWSFTGRMPESVNCTGVLTQPIGTNALYSSWEGTVKEIYVAIDQKVIPEQPIMTVISRGQDQMITSNQYGLISKMIKQRGETVTSAEEVVRLSPDTDGELVVVCYVPLTLAGKVQRGNKAYVNLSYAEKETYGHMVGRVINIDSKPATENGMKQVIGSGNNMTNIVNKDNVAVVAVTCELMLDNAANTPGRNNPFFWSSEKGKSNKIENGGICNVQIITKEIAPIEKLFTKIKEVWGGQ